MKFSLSSRMLSRVAACLLGVLAFTSQIQAQTTIALRGARVIDGAGGAPLDNSVILISNGRILSVGPAAAVRIPREAEIIDYSGKTILPGLISNHSHVGIVDGISVDAKNYSRSNILRQLRQYEAYGVTTVTALGLNGEEFVSIRSELHEGRAPGADLFGAIGGIGVPRGAPPESMLPVGRDQLTRPDNAEEARTAVRAMVGQGTDIVKLWLDDFRGTVPVKMQPEIYQAVIEEAHANGVRVAAHIHDLADAKRIVEAGADIVAHGVRNAPVDAEFIELMKQRDAWYIPTIALDEAAYIYGDSPAWVQLPFFQKALQPPLRAQLEDADWREKNRTAPAAAKSRSAVRMNQRNLKTLYDAGVRIGFGTDSGATAVRIPGLAEHRELALLVQAGLTPLQAIELATNRAAALLKLEDRGAIAPGKLADFLVLDADPSNDISRTMTIRAVWHRGKRVANTIAQFRP